MSDHSPEEQRPALSQRLREIRERAEKATPGPWVSTIQRGQYGPSDKLAFVESSEDLTETGILADIGGSDSVLKEQNADFIAHSREDVPYLLSRLDAVEEALRQLRQAMKRHDATIEQTTQVDALREVRQILSSLEVT